MRKLISIIFVLSLWASTVLAIPPMPFPSQLGSDAAGRNLSIIATKGDELAPTLIVANWDVVAGWDLSTSTLNHNAAGAGAITPIVSIAPTAGVTYRVVITLSAVTVENCTYTLGGVTGTLLASATTYTDYITATSTGDLTFTPFAATSRFTISAVSIQPLVDATGDLIVDGNLTVRSPATFDAGGIGIWDINKTHKLLLGTTSDLTADRNLTFVPGDASRTITLSGNPTLADWFDQAVKTSSTPIFPTIYGSSTDSGTLTLTSTSHVNKGTISIGRLTLSDLANANGIVFGNLGTATKAIDLSGSGLSGDTDYLIYFSSNKGWKADGLFYSGGFYLSSTTAGIANLNTDAVHLYLNPDIGYNTLLRLSSASTFLAGNGTKVGSLTGCSSDGSTTITKTTHGLILATGELVHVTGSSTAADKGFYRIVSSGVSTIVVDRALSGTQTDVALTVYKDVISMHATDATNGQMLTSWSAQNKPLQLGGTVLAATTGLTSKDIFIGGEIGLGGTVNTTTTNAYVVGGGQAATTKNTGWMKVYISGTDVAWIPYWTNATP